MVAVQVASVVHQTFACSLTAHFEFHVHAGGRTVVVAGHYCKRIGGVCGAVADEEERGAVQVVVGAAGDGVDRAAGIAAQG